MLKYLVILTIFASGFHALIPDYAENDTLSNDINDLQDNNPLAAVYGNLMETLKYPKDVELNEYITFSTNNPQQVDAQSKNNENAGVGIGNFTTTEAPVYRPTKMEVEFNSLTWEERWQRVWESLGGFLESHDVDLVVPYYESAMVRVSLRDYMNNGSAIDFKIYPEGKTAVDGGDKGPKEEVESLKRLTLIEISTAGGGGGGHKRVIIHVPVKVKHIHHTHTVVKHVGHEEPAGDEYKVIGYSGGIDDGELVSHGHGHGAGLGAGSHGGGGGGGGWESADFGHAGDSSSSHGAQLDAGSITLGGGHGYGLEAAQGGGHDFSQGGGHDFSQGGGHDFSQGGGHDFSQGGGHDFSQGGGHDFSQGHQSAEGGAGLGAYGGGESFDHNSISHGEGGGAGGGHDWAAAAQGGDGGHGGY
ncbi:unnamed protein product [Phyllotreta striolata]|uniref:Uncharacterized protein n=1 Tax=Phyllotreta striolata TaxID=444603 RepID=A0A9N9TFI3_PHYSR|nr:unnamed protein product [Phyllotreta striolata]